MKKNLFAFTTLLFSSTVLAFDYPYTLRSPEAMLMGDAFTAVNDDAYTLFYNPASLARHKRDFTLNPLNPQFNLPNVLNDMDRFENMPDGPSGVSDILMNYPIHASSGIAPGFKLFNFGLSLISVESYDILLRNKSHPMLDLDLRNDKGVLMGFGFPIGTSRIGRKSMTGQQTSIGVSAKYLERTGIRDTLAVTGPTVTGSISQGELTSIINSLGKVKGIGYGFDAGVEHINRQGNSQFVMGLSMLDITGTDFTEESTEDDLQVADIRDQLNLGFAVGQDFNFFHYILSADVRSLNEQIELMRRLRLGVQAGIPGLKLMAGLNSGYYSYGFTLDIGIMKLTTGFYDIEIGTTYKQIKSQRFVIYLSLFDFSFDA